jgi:hypothetical protein
MTLEEIKIAISTLNPKDQKRLIIEVLPQIMPEVCTDESCLKVLRDLVDEQTVKGYRAQHMGGI